MNPARQTKFTRASSSAATSMRSYTSRSRPLEASTRTGIPRSCARAIPGAPSRLLMTIAISAPQFAPPQRCRPAPQNSSRARTVALQCVSP